MILNGLHARPILVRALPWYKQRALRRLARSARTRQATMAPLAPIDEPTPVEPGALDESA